MYVVFIRWVKSRSSLSRREAASVRVDNFDTGMRRNVWAFGGGMIAFQRETAEWRIIDGNCWYWGKESCGVRYDCWGHMGIAECGHRVDDTFLQEDLIKDKGLELILFILMPMGPVLLHPLYVCSLWRRASALPETCCNVLNKIAWSATSLLSALIWTHTMANGFW